MKMPSRKRKSFVPPLWVDPTSDNEWQVTSIPSITDMGNDQPVSPLTKKQKYEPVTTTMQVLPTASENQPSTSAVLKPTTGETEQSTSAVLKPTTGDTQPLTSAVLKPTTGNTQPSTSAVLKPTIGDTQPSTSAVLNPRQFISSEPFVEMSDDEDTDQSDQHEVNDSQREYYTLKWTGSENVSIAGVLRPGEEEEGQQQIEDEEEVQEEEEMEIDDDEEVEVEEEIEPEDADGQAQAPPGIDAYQFEEDQQLPEYVDFHTLKRELAEQWMLIEVAHRVSKTASNAFWRLANKMFPEVYEKKKEMDIKTKVPQFAHIRRILHVKKVPPISMEVAYENKETGEVITVKGLNKLPVSKFSPDKFTKLYEQASVKAEDIMKLHREKCKNYNGETEIQYSCDAMSECKSSVVSLDVYSFKMLNCRQIYPHKIVRPLKGKVESGPVLDSVISDLLQTCLRIAQYLADNPKRANAKECLNHGALYPCEYCFAKGCRVTTEKMIQAVKKIEAQLLILNEKVSEMSGSQTEEFNTLLNVQKDLQKELKKGQNKKSHIVWPYSTKNQEPRSAGKMLEIVEKIENNEPLTHDEKKGVIRRSPLYQVPSFDIVKDSPVDYMHAVCIGVGKRLIELTFKIGDARPRKTTRKLSSPADYDKLMLQTKVIGEFPRRARELKFSVMKATEFRNVIIFFSLM